MNMLKIMINRAFQNVRAFEFFESFESLKSQNTSTLSIDNEVENNNRWNSDEIDFFDSMYDEKFVVIDQVIEHIEKNIYFRNVNDFIDRVKNITNIKNVELIRQNLYICFRDTTLTWYTTIFIENEKRLIKLNENVEEWTRVLHKRFKKLLFVVMIAFNKKRYIMKNARRWRKFMKYVYVIIKAAKIININVFS